VKRVSQYLPEGAEINGKSLTQDGWCLGRNLNTAWPEKGAGFLTLRAITAVNFISF
jgi:hypothetical protein